MSEQKKINLSALNKNILSRNTNLEEQNEKIEKEIENNIEEIKENNENKKITKRMKKIINGDFIEKTEKEVKDKIKVWEENEEKIINLETKDNIINFDWIEKNNKKDEDIELFSNYRSDFENNYSHSTNDTKMANEKISKTDKEENRSWFNIFLIIFFLLILLWIWIFFYKDKLKNFVSNISEKNKIETNSQSKINSKIEEKINKQSIEIKWFKYDFQVKEWVKDIVYMYDWISFEYLEELKKYLEKKSDNKIKEQNLKRQKEINEKIKIKIKEEYLKN